MPARLLILAGIFGLVTPRPFVEVGGVLVRFFPIPGPGHLLAGWFIIAWVAQQVVEVDCDIGDFDCV